MIAKLKGKILQKNHKDIIIDCNGVGYLCFISDKTYIDIPNIGDEVSLFIHYHVTDISHSLYGFSNIAEKEMFLSLISISGIGPKIGIQILSSILPDRFRSMIITNDVKLLSTLPGIGPKTAKRLIVELKEKFTHTNDNNIIFEDSSPNTNDAYQALISLGYQSAYISPIIQEILLDEPELKTEQIIKLCLKRLK